MVIERPISIVSQESKKLTANVKMVCCDMRTFLRLTAFNIMNDLTVVCIRICIGLSSVHIMNESA